MAGIPDPGFFFIIDGLWFFKRRAQMIRRYGRETIIISGHNVKIRFRILPRISLRATQNRNRAGLDR